MSNQNLLFRYSRKDPRGKNTKVIFLTNLTVDDSIFRGIALFIYFVIS